MDVNTKYNNQHIIAIGASAGGMEEIHSFFDHTPVDRVSYVIVQHLSPDFKSRMAELLAKHSKLKICEVEDNMAVEENQVYMIPNDKFMTLKDGKLHLADKEGKESPHMTINTFFNSLAADRGDKAIGIILSGTGTDGSLGIKAIKEAGGMVLVQNPLTAKFSGMPSHAISSGFADAILSTEAMPKVIENYVKNLPWKPLTPKEKTSEKEEISEEEEGTLKRILELIKEQLPNDFSDYKHPTIRRRIKRRMAFSNFTSMEQYLAYLKNNYEEMESLAENFLISVTHFFRDEEAFEILKTDIIPEIVKNHTSDKPLKIWVAGCATGEEAYSIAILITEYLTQIKRPLDVKIFATDIDRVALDHASKGIFPETISKEVSEERLERFFTPEGGGFKVKKALRTMLIFAEHNLIKNPPYCNIDLISCRNLLIYMNPVLQKKVFSMFHFGLKQGGYLFLGPSENANLREPEFLEINKKWKIYNKTKASRTNQFNNFSLPVPDERKAVPVPDSVPSKPYKGNDLVELVNEEVMKECGFAGVCIDKNMNIVQYFGDLGKYLSQKMFEFNLEKLLKGQLAVAVRTAISKVRKLNEKVTLRNIPVNDEEPSYQVNLYVKPVNSIRSEEELILVLFNEEKNANVGGANPEVYSPEKHTLAYMAHLEQELKETKEELISVRNELEASSENMQSFSEELLSANEEMQSGNEELESVNEELQTINSEHLAIIKELTIVNDDLDNYFRSNVNGQLYVDNNLLLKKFSPASVKHINLRDSDIGRPLNNITTNIKFETLEEDIKNVVADGNFITKEVQSTTERWYQMMVMPYIRQVDNQQDGVIITFNDITNLKRSQEELSHNNKSLIRVNADLDNFVYSASHDLKAPMSNIEGLINLLKKRVNEDDQLAKQYLDYIDSAMSKFKLVLKDLSDIGKIENEVLNSKDHINIKELISDIRLSILDQVINTNTKIQYDFAIKEINFSRKNLRSIFYNLITNSIKYKSPERDPEILIKTETGGGFLILTFADNGMGIKADKLSSIFSLYTRLGQQVDGEGIGLYLVKKIIDANGGKVEVESELGKGTTFKIFFKLE